MCVHSLSPPNENIHFGLPADAMHGQCRVEVQQPPPTALQTFYDARRERGRGLEVAFQSRGLDTDRNSRVALEAFSRLHGRALKRMGPIWVPSLDQPLLELAGGMGVRRVSTGEVLRCPCRVINVL